MRRFTSRVSLALLLVGASLISASAAAAATQTVTLKSTKGDQATITLNQATKRALAKNHISLKANKPASRKGNNATFPQKSGKWNFANTSGSVTYNGITRFVRGKRSVKVTRLSFTRTVKGKRSSASLIAFLGKKKVTLLALTGKVKVKMKGSRETVTGFTAKLSKKAAALLNSGLRRKAFKANQRLGSFSLTLTSRATLPGAPGTPGGPGVPGSTAPGLGFAFTPALQSALDQSGLSVTPLGPAANSLTGALSGVTLPVGDPSNVTVPGIGGTPAASASFDNGTLTATVPLAGGLQLSNGTASVTLTNPVLSVGTGIDGSSGLYFSLNGGPEVKLFDIDTAKLEAAATPSGQLDLNGLVTELSSELAGTINQLAGQPVVQTGQVAGGLTLIVPSSTAGSGA
ncbi:MAG: hypothetical protein ACXVE7_15235 [Solirubrobacteraceae bacterium]